MWAGSIVTSMVGLGVIMSSLAVDIDDDSAFSRRWIGGSVISGVGCILMIPAYVFGARSNRDRQAAFVAYEHDLPESLGFCVDANGQPADCGASARGSYGSPIP